MIIKQIMIINFKDKETEKVFNNKYSAKLPQDIQKRASFKLAMLDASVDLSDLKTPPSNHLEALKGSMEGKYSIRINNQWRICFKWEQNNAFDVEIIDYH